GFILECNPLSSAGEDTARILKGMFESPNIPSGSSLQFMIYGSPNIKPLLDNYVFLRESATGDSIFTEIAKQRRDFYLSGTERSLFKGYNIPVRDFRLFCSAVIPCQKTPESYAREIEPVSHLRDMIQQALNTAHLYPRRVGAEQLINLLSELLNPGHRKFPYLHYDS